MTTAIWGRCGQIAFGLALLLWSSPAGLVAQVPEIHSEHFLYGMPIGTPETNDLIIRDLYALSSNDTTKFADWVAFRLTAAEVVGWLDLDRDWKTDRWLDTAETLEAGEGSLTDDYDGAHADHDYDRGHLVPLASVRGSPQASEVNVYSNIVPQLGPLNQGPWRRLEEAERDLVCSGHVLWVLAGTLYDGVPAPRLEAAQEPHVVPTGFWRVIAIPDSDSLWLAAFTFEQSTPASDTVADHLTTVDDVEARSGLDLFPELEPEQEAALESVALTPETWADAVPEGACRRALDTSAPQ